MNTAHPRSLYIVFFLSLLVQCICSFYAWNHPLTDYHAFRQTQTAISTYYLVQEGLTINYQTPVLGKPWEIPMEFPTYQIVTALIVKIFGTSLDQTGRFVSMVFFYLSILGIFLFSRLWVAEKTTRWLLPAVIVSSPLYMFWSRTFMIESAALFFSLASVGLAYVAVQHKKRSMILIAVAFAILAGLTKITTFFVAGIFVITLVALTPKNRFRNLGMLVLMLLPGLIAGVVWNHHADMVKLANPLAENILSHNLKRFNFGTLAQRFSFRTWDSF
jgi:hypothetical protein